MMSALKIHFNKQPIALFATLFFLFSSISSGIAQCDPSPFEGVHVVQPDENLFRISQKYNISLDQISTWNNMNANETLINCQELVVSADLVNPPEVLTSKGTSVWTTVSKQPGKWHTVRPGESVALIARLYGYTEIKFREFNKMSADKGLKPGAVVRSSECVCSSSPAGSSIPTATAATGSAPTTGSKAGSGNPAPPSDYRGFMTMEESSMIDEINLMRSNPKAYVKHVKAHVAKQKAEWGWEISKSAVNSLIRDLEKSPPLSILRPNECIYGVAKTHGEFLRATGKFQHTDANGTAPWSRTKTACPSMGLSTSKGRSGMLIGSENLVAGHDNVRESLIDLLIDEGTNPPGHRETLLAPEWKYVAAYNFGTVNQMQNHWVQNFGR